MSKRRLSRCNDPELMLASGRGLLIMRAFTDELFFSAGQRSHHGAVL